MPEPEGAGRRAAPSSTNRRRAFRVPARLAIRHRRLAPEERAEHQRQLRLPEAAPLPGDPALAGWLLRIEAKLDRLAARLGCEPDGPFGPADECDVDLSSVGVGLDSREPLSAGDAVWIECLLPGSIPRRVRALARVARVGADGAASDAPRRVALDFEEIGAADRDALVRFTQDVQRCAAH